MKKIVTHTLVPHKSNRSIALMCLALFSLAATGSAQNLLTKTGGLTADPLQAIDQYGAIGSGKGLSLSGAILDAPLWTTTTGCYAKISSSPDVYKDFLCHNLGADTSLDPHTPVIGLQGAYIQWGKRGPNTTGNSRVDWKNAANDGPGGFAAASTAADNNVGAISSWNTTAAVDNSWRNADGTKNTTNDPCPTGYRLPTRTEWQGVITNNSKSVVGTWIYPGLTSYDNAVHFGPDGITKLLTLPSAGYHQYTDGKMVGRVHGMYWTSTESGSNAYYLDFWKTTSSLSVTGAQYRAMAMSIRCIEE